MNLKFRKPIPPFKPVSPDKIVWGFIKEDDVKLVEYKDFAQFGKEEEDLLASGYSNKSTIAEIFNRPDILEVANSKYPNCSFELSLVDPIELLVYKEPDEEKMAKYEEELEEYKVNLAFWEGLPEELKTEESIF